MSAYNKMSREDQEFFASIGIGKVKKTHTGNWTLHYGTLTWPKSTNAPYGVCKSMQNELVQQEGKQEDKFTIKPA